jgi:antitoxin (DNA-binding transcriptional repressor) of toxin-antitoxin stability system
MRSVGLKTLKNAGGETILISDRDRVVAELIPPRDTRAPLVSDTVLAQAIRDGVLAPPLDSGASLPERVTVAPLEDVLGGLGEDRTER